MSHHEEFGHIGGELPRKVQFFLVCLERERQNGWAPWWSLYARPPLVHTTESPFH